MAMDLYEQRDALRKEAELWSRANPTTAQAASAMQMAASRRYGESQRIEAEIAKYEREQKEQRFQQEFNASISSLMDRADPFASQRSQYATKLSDLMGMGGAGAAAPTAAAPAGGQQVTALGGRMMPGATTAAVAPAASPTAAAGGASRLSDVMQSNPFFQANMDAGQEAAKRRLAQMGMGTSGNAALELQKTAQANMSGEYFRMADLLGRLSGGYADPSAGANAGLGMLKLGEEARQFNQGRTRDKMNLTGAEFGNLPGQKLNAYWGGV